MRNRNQWAMRKFLSMRFNEGGGTPPEGAGGGAPASTPPAAPATTPKTYTEAEWNQMAANHRKAQDELKKLQDEKKQREDAEKTEAQKALDRAEQAEREAANAKRALLTLKVGTKHGLPTELAELLVGQTEEELEAHALKLKALLPQQAAPPQPGSTGQPPSGGTPPAPAPNKDALQKQYDDLLKAGKIPEALKVRRELDKLK